MEIEMVSPDAYEDLSDRLFNLVQSAENLKPNPSATETQKALFKVLRENLLKALGKVDQIVISLGDTETH
jgi:hypothetical protein